jgi:hypothetical protein
MTVRYAIKPAVSRNVGISCSPDLLSLPFAARAQRGAHSVGIDRCDSFLLQDIPDLWDPGATNFLDTIVMSTVFDLML